MKEIKYVMCIPVKCCLNGPVKMTNPTIERCANCFEKIWVSKEKRIVLANKLIKVKPFCGSCIMSSKSIQEVIY